jgi:23S rRNA (cytosine1962-C5)-methyltransferase
MSLPASVAAKVLAGSPVVELEALPQGGPAAEPGRPLLLLDARGQVLASGISDPENSVIRILSPEAVESFDLGFFRRRVQAALELRRALGLVDGCSAYRLLNGEGDGLSGFVADVYGPYVVLYVYSRGLINSGRILAAAIFEIAKPRGIVLKVRPKGGPPAGKVKQEILGEEPPGKLIVHEVGVPYEVHLLSGLNVGLFTDMREHRRRLGRFAAGRRVLNAFSYTGSLSLAAALAGATEVTSVDLSAGVLKWARENFRLSGLEPDAPHFRFESNDVNRFLRRARQESAEYDTIVLDPPTYSAARAAGWSMKNDYPDLIALAASLLNHKQGGILWVSANTLKNRALDEQIETGMRQCGREAQVLEIGGLPPDYPTPLNYPQARYLEVYYLRVS